MTQEFIGRWVADGNPQAYLEFSADGKLSGSDGANRLVTTWSDTDGVPVVRPAMMTLKAVKGMLAWVTKVHTVSVTGDSLSVIDRAGSELGTLRRVTS